MSKSERNDAKRQSDSDWDINESGRQQGSQVKIALLMVVTLVGALGFFVYRKYGERVTSVANAEEFQKPARQESAPGQYSAPESEPREDLSASDAEKPLDLFGSFRSSASSNGGGREQDSFAPGPGPAPPVEQGEPTVADWSTEVPSDVERQASAAGFANEDPFDSAQPAPHDTQQPQTPVNDEPVVDLFSAQGEPAPAPAADPFAFDDPSPTEAGPAEQGDPFSMPLEPQTVTQAQPVEIQPVPEPLDLSVQTPAPLPAPEWGPDLPEAPADATLPVFEEPVEGPAPTVWEDGPGFQAGSNVIPVNSDDHPGGAAQQTAAEFSDPFFTDDERPAADEDVPAQAPPPSFEEPATLDFGTTAPQAQVVDWSLPSGDTSADVPAASPPTSTPEPGFGTSTAAATDPFALVATAQSETAAFDDRIDVHTVRSGDSYWSISRRYYGAGKYFTALAAYNRSRIADPDDLLPGMKVLVPEMDTLRERFPALLGGPYAPGREQSRPPGFFVSPDGQPMYRVGKSDTLSGIAAAHLGRASRWRQIYGLNHDRLQNANHLKPGLELRLPPDATQARLVSRPAAVR